MIFSGLGGPQLLVDLICQALSFLVLCSRLYVAFYLNNRLRAPDVFITLSWLFFLGNTLQDFLAKKMGLWDPRIVYTLDDKGTWPGYDAVITDKKTLQSALLLMYITMPCYYISLYFVKMTFLFLYKQVFPVDMRKLRLALYAAIGVTTVGYVIIIGMQLLWCLPAPRNYTLNQQDRCLSWAATVPYFFSTGFHISTDLLIYILPFFMLSRLYRSCSRRKFVGVVWMFSLGLLCILASVARIVLGGLSFSVEKIAVWMTVEMASSIIVACILPLKRLWDVWRRKVRGPRTSSRSRSGSRRRTFSASWSKCKSMAWARKFTSSNWNDTADVEKEGAGGTDSLTWTYGDVSTGRSITLLTQNQEGLEPRRDAKIEGPTRPVQAVMSCAIPVNGLAASGTSDNTRGRRAEDIKRKRADYFSRFFDGRDRSPGSIFINTTRTREVSGGKGGNRRVTKLKRKKQRNEEFALFTFGPVRSPSPPRSHNSSEEGISADSAPSRTASRHNTPPHGRAIFPQLSAVSNTEQNMTEFSNKSSPTLPAQFGFDNEPRVSVTSLTFGPQPKS